jgi:hypothetical protein
LSHETGEDPIAWEREKERERERVEIRESSDESRVPSSRSSEAIETTHKKMAPGGGAEEGGAR